MTKFTRKILFTVTACFVCLGIAVGTLLAVLAQSNILITTDVSVSYVSEINANVFAHYWVQGQTGGKTEMLADTKIEEGVKTQPVPIEVKLKETKRYVVFEYAFTNNMVNLDAWAHLSYTDTDSDDKNMALAWTWSSSSVEIADFEALSLNTSPRMTVPVNNVELPAGGDTVYVYVKVYIDDLREDAVFTGSFEWTFSYEEEATPIEHFTPVLSADGTTAELTAYDGEAGDHVVVPSYYMVEDASGVSDVSSVGYLAEATALKRINITKIGDNCFDSKNMVTVTLPDSITSIGKSAFDWCSKLEEINLPVNLESIGNYAFRANTKLDAKLTLPNSLTSLGAGAFVTSAITEVTVPASITNLNRAFQACASLTKINLPATLAVVGESEFYNCAALQSVNIPEGITSIGASAFSGCVNLSQITLPSTLETIGEAAFQSCRAANIAIPESVTSFGANSFAGAKLTRVVIPEGVTEIADYQFANCTELTEIVFPSTLKTIGIGAFSSCTGLTNVVLPEGLTTLSSNVFECCTNLRNVTLPESVNQINYGIYEGRAFVDCKNLTLTVTGNIDADIVGKLADVGVKTLKVVGTRAVCDFAFDDSSGERGKSVEILDLSEVQGLTAITSYIGMSYGNHLRTIILPDAVVDVTGVRLQGMVDENYQHYYDYSQFDITVIGCNEVMYSALGTVTGADGLDFLQALTAIKCLKSTVDNAAVPNVLLENPANYNKTTETINGDVYYVYTRVTA